MTRELRSDRVRPYSLCSNLQQVGIDVTLKKCQWLRCCYGKKNYGNPPVCNGMSHVTPADICNQRLADCSRGTGETDTGALVAKAVKAAVVLPHSKSRRKAHRTAIRRREDGL